ncbi:MAG: hypothetical protein V5A14_04785, partial [Desulfohalobiaceae bacterium]
MSREPIAIDGSTGYAKWIWSWTWTFGLAKKGRIMDEQELCELLERGSIMESLHTRALREARRVRKENSPFGNASYNPHSRAAPGTTKHENAAWRVGACAEASVS